MFDLEIIVHCWREKYARYLAYQLSSLIQFAPDIAIRYSVVTCSDDDGVTISLVRWYESTANRRGCDLDVQIIPLDKPEFLSRAIGRNIVSKSTAARWVWFCDSDYVFGPMCLRALVEGMFNEPLPETELLFYPGTYRVSRDHTNGQLYSESCPIDRPTILSIDPADFRPKTANRAIGGLQIVRGSTAREYGYCEGDQKSLRTHHGENLWSGSDVRFRRRFGGRGFPIHLPNLYRLRQLESGGADPHIPATTADRPPVPTPGER